MRARGIGQRAMRTFIHLEARPLGQITARNGAFEFYVEAVLDPGLEPEKIDDFLVQRTRDKKTNPAPKPGRPDGPLQSGA
jgi:hypothetical protein